MLRCQEGKPKPAVRGGASNLLKPICNDVSQPPSLDLLEMVGFLKADFSDSAKRHDSFALCSHLGAMSAPDRCNPRDSVQLAKSGGGSCNNVSHRI